MKMTPDQAVDFLGGWTQLWRANLLGLVRVRRRPGVAGEAMLTSMVYAESVEFVVPPREAKRCLDVALALDKMVIYL